MIINHPPEKIKLFDTAAGQRAIVELQARGFRLLPVDIDKKPLCRWTHFTATEPSFTETWAAFSDKRCTGVAVALGASGLVCRDFDIFESYAAFQSRYPVESAMLPTVRTSRGFHVYSRWTGPMKTTKVADGEVRGGNSYTILPPSIHSSGHVYKWIVPLPPIGTELPMLSPDVFLGVKPNWAELLAESDALSSPSSPSSPLSPTTLTNHHQDTPYPCVPTDYVTQKNRDILCVTQNDIWLNDLPAKFGTRNQNIFRLVRRLKTTAPYCDVTDVNLLQDGFHQWHQAALPTCRTKDFETSWRDFKAAWGTFNSERYGLTAAIRSAEGEAAPGVSDPALAHLAAVCRRLASKNNGKFYLSARIAAGIIGSRHPYSGQRAIENLISSKHIRIIRRGKRRAVGGRATRYRWLGGAP